MNGVRSLEVGLGLNASQLKTGLAQAAGMFSGWQAAQQAKLAALNAQMSKMGAGMGKVVGTKGMVWDMQAGAYVEQFNAKVSKIPYLMKAGATAATALGAAISGIYGVGIAKAMEYESTMAKTAALTDATAADMKLYESSLGEMAKETGVASNELAKSLYFLASSGVQGQAALDAVRLSAMGAKMGMGEAEDISRMLGSSMNIYGKQGMTMSKSMDLLTVAVSHGSAEASEYSSVMGNVMSIGMLAGQSMEQLYAAVSTYTIAGQTAGQGTTALRQLLMGIVAPSQQAAGAFQMLADKGFDIKKTLQEKGLQAALAQLHTAVGDNAEAYRVLFPSIEAMNMALTLGGPMAERYAAGLGKMSAAEGAAAKASEIYAKTAKAQWDQMKVAIGEAVQEIGARGMPIMQKLLPTLLDFSRGVLGIVEAFSKLPQGVQVGVLSVMLLAAPTAKLIGSFGAINGAITALPWGKLSDGIKWVSVELALLTQRQAAAATGSVVVQAGSAAAVTSFGKLGAAVRLAGLAFGTIAIAIGTFIVVYKAFSLLFDKIGLTDKVAQLINFATGQDILNKAMEKGVDVTKTWTKEQAAAYNAFVKLQRERAAAAGIPWGPAGGGEPAQMAPKVEPIPGQKVPTAFAAGAGPMVQRPAWAAKPASAGQPPTTTGLGTAVAGLATDPDAMTKPIALSRDMVKEWKKEAVNARKEAEEWNKALKDLAGVTAQEEMEKLRQQVAELGGVRNVKGVSDLAEKIRKLAKEGADIPKELLPALDMDASIEAAKIFTAALVDMKDASREVGVVLDDLSDEFSKTPLLTKSSILDFGPAPKAGETPKEGALGTAPALNTYFQMAQHAAKAGTSFEQIRKNLEGCQVPAEDIEAIMAQVRNHFGQTEAQAKATTDQTNRWQLAMQGVALLAGLLPGRFGDALQVIENIGQSFESVDWDARNEKGGWLTAGKFNAMAGAVGQIGGMAGGTAGAAIQGAMGGAMTGFAVGGPIGAAIGGVAGGIMGIFGAKKKKAEEEKRKAEENLKALEEMTSALKDQYGSIINAQNAAVRYGVDLKKAMDTKDAKALEGAMKDLEKRMKGMATAVEGAAGLAKWKPVSPEAAAAQGALFGSVFWSAVRTEGLVKAVEALGEPFDAMMENASEEMKSLLAPISQQINLARTEAFANAAQGASDLAKIVTGLSDAGVVSISDLTNASVVAYAQYQQALSAAKEAGLADANAQEAAMRAVGPAVAALVQLYQDMGIPLDQNLQTMMDIAAAQGMMFPETAMERAAGAMERVAAALEKAFGLSTGLADNMDRVSGVRVPYEEYGGQRIDVGLAEGTKGPVVVKKDMVAKIHAGEGLMVIPRSEMTTGGFAYGSFREGIYGEGNPRGPRERNEGGVDGYESTSPAAPSSAEIVSTIETAVEALMPKIRESVARAAPVNIAPTIQINEDPEGDKESRTARRRSTVDAVADAFRRREPALIIEARRALGER